MKYAGVAITVPFPGAILTGLVATLGPACASGVAMLTLLRVPFLEGDARGARRIRACGHRADDTEAQSKSAGRVFRDGSCERSSRRPLRRSAMSNLTARAHASEGRARVQSPRCPLNILRLTVAFGFSGSPTIELSAGMASDRMLPSMQFACPHL
jgi:hypothetical protein